MSIIGSLAKALMWTLAICMVGCLGEPDPDNDIAGDSAVVQDITTTLELTFTSRTSGEEARFSFTSLGQVLDASSVDDSVTEGADLVVLEPNTVYDVTVEMFNDTVDASSPRYQRTGSFEETAEFTQLFFIPTAPDPVITHAYDDLESDYATTSTEPDLPVGLASVIETKQAGRTGLRVDVVSFGSDAEGTPPAKTEGAMASDGRLEFRASFIVDVL